MIFFGYLIPIAVIIISYIKLYKLVYTEVMANTYRKRHKNKSKCNQSIGLMKKSNSSAFNENEFNLEHLYNLHKKGMRKSYTKTEIEDDNHSDFKNEAIQCIRFENRRNAIKTYKVTIKSKDFLLKRDIKLAKVILIKVFALCACWTPYIILVLLAQLCNKNNISTYITPNTTTVSSFFAKSSIISNALIYTLTQKECSAFYYRFFLFKKNNLPDNVLRRRNAVIF
jgi:hypothetical protein